MTNLKKMFQENKARQIFRKMIISYPLIRTRTCTYQGVRNICFSENLACFVFLKHPFWDSSFCLITDDFCQTIFEIILNIFFVPTKKYTRLLTNRLHDTTWTNSRSKYEQKLIHEYCKYKTASLHNMRRRKVIMKIFCYFQQIVSQQKQRMKLELQSNRNRS